VVAGVGKGVALAAEFPRCLTDGVLARQVLTQDDFTDAVNAINAATSTPVNVQITEDLVLDLPSTIIARVDVCIEVCGGGGQQDRRVRFAFAQSLIRSNTCAYISCTGGTWQKRNPESSINRSPRDCCSRRDPHSLQYAGMASPHRHRQINKQNIVLRLCCGLW
jgi:hypothetical protein